MKKYIIVFCMSVCISMVARAQFSGKGTGTAGDPYQITNADELFEVRNDLAASYKLMNDIDLKQWIAEDNPTQGWSPIGNITIPFLGTFDGNFKVIKNLFIRRPSLDYQGFFGYVGVNGVIKNTILLNADILGGSYCGILAGYVHEAQISCNTIMGRLSGNASIGGLIGVIGINTSCRIEGNYVNVDLISTKEFAGGLFGKAGGSHIPSVDIVDNFIDGKIKGVQIGGICGSSGDSYYSYGTNYVNCRMERNIVKANLFGESSCGLTNFSYSGAVSNNLFLGDTLAAVSSIPRRIATTEYANNYAYVNTVVMSNGKMIEIEDNSFNGISYGLKTLKRKSTYEGMGFDFSSQWTIVEGETFPYNKKQSTPPIVTSFTAGSKGIISGTAEGNGTVYVMIGKDVYESYILDKKWSVTLGAISKGTVVKVTTHFDRLSLSIPIVSIATEGEIEIPDVIKGDANGDGMVDAADVVAIVNNILGKSSSSFVKANADINGDGNILVDDAVATVQLVLGKQ